MAKETWKAGNMLYPLPAVMVSVSDGEGNDNIITVAWSGTVCTNPAGIPKEWQAMKVDETMMLEPQFQLPSSLSVSVQIAESHCSSYKPVMPVLQPKHFSASFYTVHLHLLLFHFSVRLHSTSHKHLFPEIPTAEMQSPAAFFQVPCHPQGYHQIHYNSAS